MKIIDVPQTGKLGLTVTYPESQRPDPPPWVVPANPRTAEQLLTRSHLGHHGQCLRRAHRSAAGRLDRRRRAVPEQAHAGPERPADRPATVHQAQRRADAGGRAPGQRPRRPTRRSTRTSRRAWRSRTGGIGRDQARRARARATRSTWSAPARRRTPARAGPAASATWASCPRSPRQVRHHGDLHRQVRRARGRAIASSSRATRWRAAFRTSRKPTPRWCRRARSRNRPRHFSSCLWLLTPGPQARLNR